MNQRDLLEQQIIRAFKVRAEDPHSKFPSDLAGWTSFAAEVADAMQLDVDQVEGAASIFYDLRNEQDFKYPGGKRKARIRNAQVVRRPPAQVTGIMLHQTAVEYGVSSAQVKASGGDRELALARRGLDVACHCIAFRSGMVVFTHDFDVFVNHGNALNGSTLGIEIDGRYSGLLDDPTTAAREDLQTTWKGDPSTFGPVIERAAADALRRTYQEGRRLGMPIRFLYAHRQTSSTRRSDPGQAIWERIAIGVGVNELGLKLRQLDTWGEGRPIPREWDPEGDGRY